MLIVCVTVLLAFRSLLDECCGWARDRYRKDHIGICLVTSCIGRIEHDPHGRLSRLPDHYVQLSTRIDVRNTCILRCPISWVAELKGCALAVPDLGYSCAV